MAQYQWRAYTNYEIPYDPNYHMTHGVTPDIYSSWQSAEATGQYTSDGTYQYWYHDSNWPVNNQYTDANASRLVVSVTQRWAATVANDNTLTIKVYTTINSVVRDQAYGTNTDTPGRTIQLFTREGGTPILTLTDTQIATNHTLYTGPMNLGEETIVIPPGQSAERSSLYLHNQAIGHSSYDDIWIGIQFKNPLPADYRPGERKISGVSRSLNRAGGVCDRHGYGEMRTLNGGVGTDNPPSRKQSGIWYNMRKGGLE